MLIGDGPRAAELRAQVDAARLGDRVVMAGAQANVAELLPAFDVFVLPSLTEGISIALLEACASGLAVVASAVGGNVEIIRDGENGRLVGLGDDAALEDALDALLDDGELRARLGRAAATWVASHASIEVMREAYERFYAEARCSRK